MNLTGSSLTLKMLLCHSLGNCKPTEERSEPPDHTGQLLERGLHGLTSTGDVVHGTVRELWFHSCNMMRRHFLVWHTDLHPYTFG